MRILVLGDSTTAGAGLADRDGRWPKLLAARLEELTGEPTVLSESVFHATSADAPGFAESKANDFEPDVVLMMVTGYGFRLRSVHAKVKRRYGERAARAVRWVEKRAEGREGLAAQGRRRQKLYSFGRALAHRVVGTEPLATPAELFATYTRTFSLLARHEGLRIVTLHYFRPSYMGGPAEEVSSAWQSHHDDAEVSRMSRDFNERIYADVRSRHFEQIFFSDDDDPRVYENGSIRPTQAGHEVFARMTAAVILRDA